jgi:hypothetical protein
MTPPQFHAVVEKKERREEKTKIGCKKNIR